VHVEVDDLTLDIARWDGHPDRTPIVLLHEGLGSVSAWGDFPAALAAATGAPVVAYSRPGYGRSTVEREPFGVDYMHREAARLPALLDRLELQRPVLFGHSDGASIALIAAAQTPDRVAALVLEAPHVFVEDLTVASIAAITAGYPDNARLRAGLARHHADPDGTFGRWSAIWLHPDFRAWNITALLPAIAAPTLVLQGRDDEYGTAAQVDAILAAVPRAEATFFPDCGHAPHRDARAGVLERTAAFLASA
jgi:pimeloyl-ACP methyl ester carboxylesterase